MAGKLHQGRAADPLPLLPDHGEEDVGHQAGPRLPSSGPLPLPAPSSFLAAFRLLSQRKVGGGPKAIPADEMTFLGDLGRGPLVLTSRVRLNDPLESFYTSAGHRLRDSKVGSGGHWVDIQVAGPCTDDDLSLIQRLAQAEDTRQVEVRRKDTRPNTRRARP